MNIGELKKFEKCVEYNYLPLFDGKYESIIKTNENNVLKLHKMPVIVDLSKNYKDFSVSIEKKLKINGNNVTTDIENDGTKEHKKQKLEDDKENKNYSCILIVKNSENFVKITYKYEYYTAAEILDIYNIPKIVSFQTIGHILHLNLREEHTMYKKLIGELFLDKTKNIKTVVTKSNNIQNVYRNIDYELLAGEDDLITIHTENNTKFYIDYKNVYWNGKLQSERKMLLNSIKKNETIADVFCGAGPITVQAIKKGIKVYCNDLNPDAIKCIKKSVDINKINSPMIYNLDANDFLTHIIKQNIKIDHFIMNLPETGLSYINVLQKYQHNFHIHNYFFCNDSDDLLSYVKKNCFFDITNENLRYIRKVSPHKNMYKLTIFVQNKSE
ncbi:tRNA(m(1)G37)methyltransferase [Binucleata daphniae]